MSAPVKVQVEIGNGNVVYADRPPRTPHVKVLCCPRCGDMPGGYGTTFCWWCGASLTMRYEPLPAPDL